MRYQPSHLDIVPVPVANVLHSAGALGKPVASVLSAITGANAVVTLQWVLAQLADSPVKASVRGRLIAAFREAAAGVHLQGEMTTCASAARRSARRETDVARAGQARVH